MVKGARELFLVKCNVVASIKKDQYSMKFIFTYVKKVGKYFMPNAVAKLELVAFASMMLPLYTSLYSIPSAVRKLTVNT